MLGKTIMVDSSYKTSVRRYTTNMLVNIDIRLGKAERTNIISCDLVHSQVTILISPSDVKDVMHMATLFLTM